ncbi:MAG: hypothetical protein LHW56_01535 [Candidatus Cloacimonetes bacterium]|nr:hypothetical protein [Candidatus Cloacimonadota bacterium]MDY0171569.1 hypothetical protein [Candidatus Cloacimonadaceae bacterium]
MKKWWQGQTEEEEDKGWEGYTGYAVIDLPLFTLGLVAVGAAFYFLHPDQHPDMYY